jgi:hypothetical protein
MRRRHLAEVKQELKQQSQLTQMMGNQMLPGTRRTQDNEIGFFRTSLFVQKNARFTRGKRVLRLKSRVHE